MPTYRYRCSDCDCYQDVIRSISAQETVPACPHCNNMMVRLYEPTPVQFKGTGFYKTGD